MSQSREGEREHPQLGTITQLFILIRTNLIANTVDR